LQEADQRRASDFVGSHVAIHLELCNTGAYLIHPQQFSEEEAVLIDSLFFMYIRQGTTSQG